MDDQVDILELSKTLGEKEKQYGKYYSRCHLFEKCPIVQVAGDDFDRIRSLLAKKEVDLTKPGVSSKTKILNDYAWNFGDADE